MSSSHILERSPLSDIYIVNIFFQSEACLLTFLIVFLYEEKKFFNVDKNLFTIFLLCFIIFASYLRNLCITQGH